MSGLVLHYEECRRQGLRPVLGVELTEPRRGEVLAAGPDAAGMSPRADGAGSHGRERLVVLARNAKGYADLCEVVTRRHLEADRFRFEEVFAREWPDFVLLTASPGLLGVLAGTPNRDRLYGELIGHSAATRRRSRELEAARALDLPLVAQNDCYFPPPRAMEHAPAPHGHRPQLHAVAPAARGVRLAAGLPAQRRPDGGRLSVPPPGPGHRRAPRRGVRLHRAAPGRVDPAARRRAPGRDTGQPPGAAGLGGARAQLRGPRHLCPGPAHPAHGAGHDREARLPVVLPDRQGDPRLGQWPPSHPATAGPRTARSCAAAPPTASRSTTSASPTSIRSGHDLYFQRFLNEDRASPPDADLDFGWDERRRGAEVHHPALGRGARGGHLHHPPLPRPAPPSARRPRSTATPTTRSPASSAATSRGRRASTTPGSAACGSSPPRSGASRGSWASIRAAC